MGIDKFQKLILKSITNRFIQMFLFVLVFVSSGYCECLFTTDNIKPPYKKEELKFSEFDKTTWEFVAITKDNKFIRVNYMICDSRTVVAEMTIYENIDENQKKLELRKFAKKVLNDSDYKSLRNKLDEAKELTYDKENYAIKRQYYHLYYRVVTSEKDANYKTIITIFLNQDA